MLLFIVKCVTNSKGKIDWVSCHVLNIKIVGTYMYRNMNRDSLMKSLTNI